MLNQKTWFSRISLSGGNKAAYTLHDKSYGVYVFIIQGEAETGGSVLEARDGLGMSETSEINIQAKIDSDILLIEVPMQV